LARAAAKL